MTGVALSGALFISALSFAAPAAAQDITVWQPTTAAGGARVSPEFWDNQASYRVNGGGLVQQNVTIAPSAQTYYDYSEHSTENNGGQTSVVANANLENGGSFSVVTQDQPVFQGPTTMNQNNDTDVNVNATQGDGSTLSTSTHNDN
jgi:hypothetical protein